MCLIMKKQVILIFVALLLFSFSNSGFGVTLKSTVINDLNNGETDSIQNQRNFRILKVNPFQTLFCEIPVSFEAFYKQKSSIQFQLGFIFPLPEKSELREFLVGLGHNYSDYNSEKYFYRRNPYCNHGLSFKIEFRKYVRHFYYAPQLMYKFCFYKEATFPVYSNSITVNQTESKFSNIFGLGFIIGHQSCYRNLVIDMFGGVGLRQRYMSVTVIKIQNPWHNTEIYPNTKENFDSFYPFVNFGYRFGFKL